MPSYFLTIPMSLYHQGSRRQGKAVFDEIVRPAGSFYESMGSK